MECGRHTAGELRAVVAPEVLRTASQQEQLLEDLHDLPAREPPGHVAIVRHSRVYSSTTLVLVAIGGLALIRRRRT